jgi:hypothetical protein
MDERGPGGVEKQTVFKILGAAFVGGALVGFSPQLPALLDRPSCSETVMKAVSTQQPVSGTYSCFDKAYQARLEKNGIDSDAAFAKQIGQTGRYRFVRKTADGGYAYEFDQSVFPHDGRAAIKDSFSKAWDGLRHGNFTSPWMPVQVTWREVTGDAQGSSSAFFVFYLDPDGKINKVK